jgi:hypothetical protein
MIKSFSTNQFLTIPGSVYICRVIPSPTPGRLADFAKTFQERWPSMSTFLTDYEKKKKESENFTLEYRNEKKELLCIICAESASPGETEKRVLAREQAKALLSEVLVGRSDTVIISSAGFLSCEHAQAQWEWMNVFTTLSYDITLCMH